MNDKQTVIWEVETPEGSGNFIKLFKAHNGDFYLEISNLDCMGMKNQATAKFFGLGKSELTPNSPSQKLLNAILNSQD